MIGQLKRALLRLVLRWPVARRALFRRQDRLSQRSGWARRHPIDHHLGIDTSGLLSRLVLEASSVGAVGINYVGCQPSIVRAALQSIPEPARCAFVDIGCGKGRVLAVAAEFPFRALHGVEIAADLAEIARRNAAILAAASPQRPPIAVHTASALDWPFPDGDLVVFNYNALDGALTPPFVRRLEQLIAADPRRRVWIICVNPVQAASYDASLWLRRFQACRMAYAPDELGYGPDSDDIVLVYMDRDNPAPPVGPRPDRAISVTPSGLRAEFAD